nr:hypothetical protein [uncultured Chryseobacterium sp.]
MKNKFILWLSLLIAISITFHSCRTDLEAIVKHNEEKSGEHIHQKISTGIFQKETFLSGVNDFKRTDNPLSGKSSANTDYLRRFFIDETSIYKMDVNNTQTYALRAYNIFENPETVYNLVYRKNANDVAFSIVKILDNELIPVYDSQKGIVTKINNPSTARICSDFYSIEIWHCKEGQSWSQCDKCAQCLFTSSGYTSYECGGGGGGSTGGGGSFPGGGDNGGGGGGTGLYDPSGYTFDPNIPPTIEPSYVRAARAGSFFHSQTDQAKSWAVEHADIYCNILEYYLDHIPPLSPPQNSYYQDFANFAIQVFMENPNLTWEQFYDQIVNNPCTKTKAILTNPQVQAKINELKTQSTAGGEKGVKFKTDGTPSATITGGAHSVNFGDKTGYAGAYHNHTPTGIPMLSPPDIDQLLGFARAQPTSNPANVNNAFMGMVAPNGMHYVIWFNGTYQDALTNFSQEQLNTFNIDYRILKNDLVEPILNGTTYVNSNGLINNAGVEKLFFETLKNMGLEGKVNLQRIESDGTVKIVSLNSSNQPTSSTCSQ